MSMVGNFLLVSDNEIAALLAAPDTVHELLDRRVYEAESPTDYVDVDKTWHALHFLLNESAWDGAPPLNFIAVGGEPVGDEDVGYGPARALRAHEVTSLHQALERLDLSTLLERFDGPRMDALEIYQSPGWAEYDPWADTNFAYFSRAYEDLRALVRKGARSGRGILIWLS